jgi:surface polysaccharide O-acyltransferase-like enzyme
MPSPTPDPVGSPAGAATTPAPGNRVAPDPGRLPFLDTLRIAALALLIPYHVGLVYVTWPFHVKSPAASTALEPWLRVVEPWRLSVLFLVAGAITALTRGRARPGWLRARMRRLGLPLLAGVCVLVPPQAWWQVVDRLGYTGGFLDFLPLYFGASRAFCPSPDDCLILPTWNHLWFLPYLMVYTLVLWASLRWAPGWLDRTGQHLSRHLSAITLLLLPWAVLALARLALRPHFTVTHALVDDALGHAQYLPVFLLGALWARTAGAWDAVARLRHAALAIAVAAWLTSVAATGLPPEVLRAAYAAQQWAGVVAAVGWARTLLDTDGPARRGWSDRILAIYLLHQTVLIGLFMAMRPLALPPVAEGVLLVAGTAVLSLAGVEALGRVRALRPWLGLPTR